MDHLELSGLTEQAGQLFMTGIGGLSLTEEEKNFIREENVGFVILFSRNFESFSQFRSQRESPSSSGQAGCCCCGNGAGWLPSQPGTASSGLP